MKYTLLVLLALAGLFGCDAYEELDGSPAKDTYDKREQCRQAYPDNAELQTACNQDRI